MSDNVIIATGRRKSASASVRLIPGTGKITINKKDIREYLPTEALVGYVNQPFVAVNLANKFDVIANIKGGGMVGQAGALRHGIARALVKSNEDLKPILKSCGMMTRDSRVKERKKPGQPGARKRFQFSKR
jgi:small subunit ribosomal protein S9